MAYRHLFFAVALLIAVLLAPSAVSCYDDEDYDDYIPYANKKEANNKQAQQQQPPKKKYNQEKRKSTPSIETTPEARVVQKQKSQNNMPLLDHIFMDKFSWQSPLSYENKLSEWEINYSTQPNTQNVMLTSSIPGQMGHFWHKTPLPTSNFEVDFVFEVKGPEITASEGFAFWYSYDNMAIFRPSEIKYMNLFGNKSNLKGLGVFFSTYDRLNRQNPSISVAYSPNGNRTFNTTSEIPTTTGVYYKYRNQPEGITHAFKLTANDTGIFGEIKVSTSNNWIQCFNMTGVTLNSGGYFGFTAYNGPEYKSGVSDAHIIRSFTVYDLNVNTAALGNPDNSNQVDLLNQINLMTYENYKFLSEQATRDQVTNRSLNNLMLLVQKLSTDINDIRKELHITTNSSSTEVLQSVSELANLFHKHNQQNTNTLHSITSTIKTKLDSDSTIGTRSIFELKQLAEKAHNLEEVINARSNRTSWMTIGIIITMGCFAIFVWKRFRDMEKKHFL